MRPEHPAGRPRRSDSQRSQSERTPSFTERLACGATRFAISSPAYWLSLVLAIAWVSAGPLLGAREAAADVLEQVIGGLSFIMLFLLQRAQSKDTMALQLKLDELIASSPRASNRVLNVEDIPEEELARIRRHFETLDRLAREAGEGPLTQANAFRRHDEEQRVRREMGHAPSGGGEE
jgi:low affinity Fe/Cu permease